eukprot:scaffold3356_cov112-Isochrysis_galbana.AAC.21
MRACEVVGAGRRCDAEGSTRTCKAFRSPDQASRRRPAGACPGAPRLAGTTCVPDRPSAGDRLLVRWRSAGLPAHRRRDGRGCGRAARGTGAGGHAARAAAAEAGDAVRAQAVRGCIAQGCVGREGRARPPARHGGGSAARAGSRRRMPPPRPQHVARHAVARGARVWRAGLSGGRRARRPVQRIPGGAHQGARGPAQCAAPPAARRRSSAPDQGHRGRPAHLARVPRARARFCAAQVLHVRRPRTTPQSRPCAAPELSMCAALGARSRPQGCALSMRPRDACLWTNTVTPPAHSVPRIACHLLPATPPPHTPHPARHRWDAPSGTSPSNRHPPARPPRVPHLESARPSRTYASGWVPPSASRHPATPPAASTPR